MGNEILGQALGGRCGEIVREEVRRGHPVLQAHCGQKLITDTATGELSMPRLAMGVIVLDMTAILALAALPADKELCSLSQVSALGSLPSVALSSAQASKSYRNHNT